MQAAAQNAQINAAVQQIINAQKAPIVNAQSRYDANAQQQQTNITGLTSALADILGGIAPGVEKTYADASQRQAGFARGFSDELQARLGQNADTTSSFLQNVVGAPSSQVDQVRGQVAPAGAHDTLYGLQGFIPASTLNREGAAFTASAAQLPGIASTQGLQQIAKVQAAQRDQDAAYGDKLAGLAGTIPKLRSDLESQAFDQAYKTHSANLADSKFTLQQDVAKFNAKYKINSYNLSVDRLNLSSKRFAQQTLSQNRSYGIALSKLGLSKRADQRATLAAEYKLQSGGFTPTQINKFETDAQFVASQASSAKTKPTVAEAMQQMYQRHVPLSKAVAALRPIYGDVFGQLQLDLVGVGQQADPFARNTASAGKVSVAPNANRPGVDINPAVTSFVAQIAGIYGQPLTIGTGTNHNEYVEGSNRVSDHWNGNAADIPASGAALTRLGRSALVAAGADPAWAQKQKGGLFNIGNVQIIFNSMEGGNHFNHLHVGVRG